MHTEAMCTQEGTVLRMRTFADFASVYFVPAYVADKGNRKCVKKQRNLQDPPYFLQ
jgi:hypothetical protein